MRVKNQLASEGFELVTNKDGTIEKQKPHPEMIPFPSRGGKKKPKEKSDFYRFQVSNRKLRQALGIMNFANGRGG